MAPTPRTRPSELFIKSAQEQQQVVTLLHKLQAINAHVFVLAVQDDMRVSACVAVTINICRDYCQSEKEERRNRKKTLQVKRKEAFRTDTEDVTYKNSMF